MYALWGRTSSKKKKESKGEGYGHCQNSAQRDESRTKIPSPHSPPPTQRDPVLIERRRRSTSPRRPCPLRPGLVSPPRPLLPSPQVPPASELPSFCISQPPPPQPRRCEKRRRPDPMASPRLVRRRARAPVGRCAAPHRPLCPRVCGAVRAPERCRRPPGRDGGDATH
jgi:hypothetical protein